MKNRLLSNAVGLVLIAGIGVTGMAVFRPGVLLPATNATINAAAPAQASTGAIAGIYTGQATLKFTLGGVYSDTLATPPPPVANIGVIDLSLFLNQNGNAVSGYVNLDRTLVFSVEHTIQATPVGLTPVPGQPAPTPAAVKIGPYVQGSFDGTTLNLESERVSLFVAGRSLFRQFRITGALKPGSANTLVGEYRETLWGYAPQPLTLLGVFEIARPAAPGTAPDSGSVIQTTADRAITKQGVAVTLDVLGNDAGPNGNVLTITSVSKPQHGTATFNGSTVTYTPAPSFAGVDTFSYFVSNGKGATAVGSVNITVIGPVYLPLVRR